MFARLVQPSLNYIRFKVTPFQVLVALLLGDLAVMAMHVLHKAEISIFTNWRFGLGHDRGIAGNFLYAQELAVLVAALALFIYHNRLAVFGVLATMFAYIFIDDAFLFHEHFGLVLAETLNLPAVGSMRPRDIGEVLIFFAFGLIFFSLLAYRYLRGKAEERPIALRLLGLLSALAFCGVGFDALHVLFDYPWAEVPFALFEDGGEMIVISLFVWYTLRLLADRHKV